MLTVKYSFNLICIMAFVLLVGSYSFASTVVQGDVSGNWDLAGSPYLVINDCTVQTGSVLTIEPEVEVIIGEGLSFYVYGQLIAVGTDSQHITFRAANENVKFNKIHVMNGSSVTTVSEFVYCDFQNAQRGLYLHAFGRIYNDWTIMQTNVLNCHFSGSVTTGIYAHGEGHDYSTYQSPKRGHARVDPIIENCIFNGNSDGIQMYMQGDGNAWYSTGSTAAVIQNNVFCDLTGAALNMVPGYHPSHSGAPSFVNNTIYNCDRGAWIQDSQYDATMLNNIFYGATTAIERTGTASDTAFYNCFFNNTVNFVGYPATYGDIVMINANGDPCDLGFNIFMDPFFVDSAKFDLHITWNSPCRDAGDSSAVTKTEDFEGDPRIALGTVEVGADEFYFHLYHVGDVTPGSQISIRTIGGPGMPVLLAHSLSIQDPPQTTPFGDLYLTLPPLWSSNIGAIQANGVHNFTITVPSYWNPGDEKYFQARVGSPGGPIIRLTNLMTVTVE